MGLQFTPHLTFAGNCREAFEFYEKTFGAHIAVIMNWGEKPDGCSGLPAGSESRVMHASLKFEEGVLMGCDELPGQSYAGVKGCSIAISFPEVARGQSVLEALAQGGSVTMAMQKTFWVESFAMVEDRFGIKWMISAGKPASPEAG